MNSNLLKKTPIQTGSKSRLIQDEDTIDLHKEKILSNKINHCFNSIPYSDNPNIKRENTIVDALFESETISVFATSCITQNSEFSIGALDFLTQKSPKYSDYFLNLKSLILDINPLILELETLKKEANVNSNLKKNEKNFQYTASLIESILSLDDFLLYTNINVDKIMKIKHLLTDVNCKISSLKKEKIERFKLELIKV